VADQGVGLGYAPQRRPMEAGPQPTGDRRDARESSTDPLSALAWDKTRVSLLNAEPPGIGRAAG
jgi:hypothetical protein